MRAPIGIIVANGTLEAYGFRHNGNGGNGRYPKARGVLNVLNDLDSHARVRLHYLPLILGELTWVQQHGIWDTDLTDVMHRPAISSTYNHQTGSRPRAKATLISATR